MPRKQTYPGLLRAGQFRPGFLPRFPWREIDDSIKLTSSSGLASTPEISGDVLYLSLPLVELHTADQLVRDAVSPASLLKRPWTEQLTQVTSLRTFPPRSVLCWTAALRPGQQAESAEHPPELLPGSS